MSQAATAEQVQAEAATPVYRNIAKSTGIYSIAVLAGKMSSFILLPVYTRFLNPADYGVLELLNLTSFIFATIIGVRFGDALFYFHSAAKGQTERNDILSTAFLGAAILGIAGAVAGYLLSPALSQLVFGNAGYSSAFHIVFLGFAFSLPMDVGLCYLRAIDKPAGYVVASLGHLGLSILSNVALLVVFRMGIKGVLYGSAMASCIVAAGLAIFLFRKIPCVIRWRILAGQVRYAAPLGFSGLAMFFIHFGDRFFLRKYVSLDDIGIYSLAYKMGMLISYLQMPFDIYWRAQMFALSKGPNGDRIYIRVCTYLAAGLTCAAVVLAIWIHPIVEVMAGPAFRSAADLVPWVAAAYVVRTVGAHFRSVFLLKRVTGKEAFTTWTGALVCLAGYALLIPQRGVWGAVIATCAAFAAMFVTGFWQAQRVHRYHFEYRRLLTILASAVLTVAAFRLAAPTSFGGQALLALAFTPVFGVLLALTGFFDAEERAAIRAFCWSAPGLVRQRLLGRVAA